MYVYIYKMHIYIYIWCFVLCFCLSLAKKIEAPAQLQELVSDLPSQFVSSPPALRTRQKNPLNTSKRTDGLVRNA